MVPFFLLLIFKGLKKTLKKEWKIFGGFKMCFYICSVIKK